MNKYNLSILIPARREMFLKNTVENILANKRGNTEVIVGLDGEWSNPPVASHPDLNIFYSPVSLGQRAMTNQLCRLSTAKWVMKIDAHSALDEGFDVKLLADAQEHQTIIPALYNLHAFDWVCKKCGNRWYQGPTPEYCMRDYDGKLRNENCDSREFYRDIIFKPRLHKLSEFYRFDTTLHFQYHRDRKKHPEAQGDIVETMSAQGSCFMLTRAKYWELNICDEKHGSWGQQGVEVALKTWLAGGQLVTNRKTWYSHMFRTQGGDFGFPYPMSGKEQDKAREYSRDIWFNNKFEKQIYPLSWLIEKFRPLPDWHEEKGKEVLEMVNKKGEEFYKMKGIDKIGEPSINEKEGIGFRAIISHNPNKRGIIYYTDNQIPHRFAHNVRKHILRAGLPIFSASLKPMNFGKNIHINLQRGYEAYFKQILAALEASEADVIYLCEHDWLYHPSHFDFIPQRDDTFYYNWNWYRVRASDGFAVHYDTQLVPGLVAYRKPLLDYYRAIVKHLENVGFTGDNARKVGYEPGTSKRVDLGLSYLVDKFESEYPIIDIRHGANLTSSKWSQAEFRDQKNCQGWQETTASKIPGWHFSDTDFLNSF